MKIDMPQIILSSYSSSKILYNEPMCRHTAIGTGGAASVLFVPDTLSELCFLISELKTRRLTIIGNGSKLLVSDEVYNGIVIKTSGIKGIDRYGRYITALAGEELRVISNRALAEGLTGMEWAVADKGTLGAAISLNTSHFGSDMRDIMYVAEVITRDGELITFQGDSLNMRSHNSDAAQKGYTVLRAMLRLERGEKSLIRRKMNGYAGLSETEKDMPVTAEVFTCAGDNAALHIAEAGLIGYTVGGASVSKHNVNCIINNGSATSGDILRLINEITTTVYEKKGVRLKHNMKLLGRF